MFSVFYREDVDNMFCIMKLIDNAVIADSIYSMTINLGNGQ